MYIVSLKLECAKIFNTVADVPEWSVIMEVSISYTTT